MKSTIIHEKVNLNTASDRDVLNIHGISDAIAQQIIYYRNQKGPIQRWEDLEAIPGMSKAIINTLKERTTISKT